MMDAVLGFLRLLVPNWLAQNRTDTSQSRRISRRRTMTFISHSDSSSSDDYSFSSCYSGSQRNRSIGARRDRNMSNNKFQSEPQFFTQEREGS